VWPEWWTEIARLNPFASSMACRDGMHLPRLQRFHLQGRGYRHPTGTGWSSIFQHWGAAICRNDEERFSRLLSLPSFCSMVLCAGTTITVLSTAFSSEFLLDGLVCRNDEKRFSRLLSLPSSCSMVLCRNDEERFSQI
jgi:hypothetical protein